MTEHEKLFFSILRSALWGTPGEVLEGFSQWSAIMRLANSQALMGLVGDAGFIGSNLVKAIFRQLPDTVVAGVDNMNDYYDVRLKEERLAELEGFAGFSFVRDNIADCQLIDGLFAELPVALMNHYGDDFASSGHLILCAW